jgi:hypothetical protein
MELPKRRKDRKLHADPSCAKSSTLKDDPNRMMP